MLSSRPGLVVFPHREPSHKWLGYFQKGPGLPALSQFCHPVVTKFFLAGKRFWIFIFGGVASFIRQPETTETK